MKKSSKGKGKGKGKTILIVVVVILLIGIIGGNSGTQSQTDSGNSSSQTSQEQTDNSGDGSSEEESAKSTDESDTVLADDSVVNDFISSYNAISSSPLTDIEKGNIRTKYYAYSYTYYFELLHADDTDKIDVTITETNDNADEGVKGMRDAFRDVVLAINPSLSSEEIDAYFDNMVSGNFSPNETVHGNLSANTDLDGVAVAYSPDIDLSSGHSRGHLEIVAM